MRVAISGVAIAGPARACWLQRSNHDVTLVERAPRFRSGGHIIHFWGVGYDVAERMGILSHVREAGYSVRRVQLVDKRGRRNGGFSTDALQRFTKWRFTWMRLSRRLPAQLHARDGAALVYSRPAGTTG
jgi:2-polyprenyl-6-methoxyphenol hydroxylase-like FAD-dependent oxidoreductase